MLQKIYKDFTLMFIMGMMYMVVEAFWRGWTNIAMLFIGGLCIFVVGRLNETDRFPNMPLYIQSLIGTLITLIIEFSSGMIVNVWLKLNIWDYSQIPGNIYGQICPLYSIFWFILMPFGIFVDDWTRYKFFEEEKPNSLLTYYIKFVKGE